MADTIRDVLIRVAIEQGNLSIHLDTSEADKKLDALIAKVQGITASTSGSGGSPSGALGDNGSSQLKGSSSDLGSMFGIDLQSSGGGSSQAELDLMKALVEKTNPKRGSESGGGGGKSDAEREAVEAEKAYDKISNEALKSYSKIMSEREKSEKDAERQYDQEAQAAIRSYSKIMSDRQKMADAEQKMRQTVSDNDVANAVKVTQKKKKHLAEEQSASESASKAQIQGAMQAAKGVLYLVAANDQNSESMMRNIVQIEGMYKIIQGGAAAGGVAGGAIAGLVVGLIGVNKVIEYGKELSKSYWQQMAADAVLASDKVSNAMRIIGQNARDTVSTRVDTSQASLILPQHQQRQETENENRETDADMSQSPQMRRLKRTQNTNRSEANIRRQEHEARAEFLQGNINTLDEAHQNLVAKKAELVQQKNNAVTGAKDAEKHARENAGYTTAERLLSVDIPMLGTGPGNQGSQDKAADQAQIQTQETLLHIGQEMKSVDEEDRAVLQQKAAAEQERLQHLKESLGVTREQKQAAYESMRDTKETARQDEISFGASDFGEQNKGMRLQKKHEEIQAQKAKNLAEGKDEWEGVTQMTQDELRWSLSHGGIEAQSAEEQAQKQAKDRGRKLRSGQVAQAAEEHYNELGPVLDVKADSIKSDIGAGVSSLKNTAEGIAAATEGIHTLITDLAKLDNEVKNLVLLFKSRQQLRW